MLMLFQRPKQNPSRLLGRVRIKWQCLNKGRQPRGLRSVQIGWEAQGHVQVLAKPKMVLQQIVRWLGLVYWRSFDLDSFSSRRPAHIHQPDRPFKPRGMTFPARDKLAAAQFF